VEYQHEQQSVHLVVYHIIWCPKRRRRVLVGPVHDRLKQIIHEVAHEHDWQIIPLAIQPEHVHLFIRANPYTLPSDIPRLIKGRSAHDLRQEFPHLRKLPSLWTRSFCLSTAGQVSSALPAR
jgi:putative transposase